MLDGVALDGVEDGPVLGLVSELRRVHADDHDGVPVLGLKLAQLVQGVQAVDAAERPEVEDNDPAAQCGRVSSRPPVLIQPPRPASLGRGHVRASPCLQASTTSRTSTAAVPGALPPGGR